jgi:tRNA(fMet)-specific endonuclease VapC
MKVLDTDTLTFLLRGHPKVVERRSAEEDEVVIPIISRIETLQGRFATLVKAANGAELQRGQERLDQAERDLVPFRVLRITSAAAADFDRLRQDKKLKKIGRRDLLIAALALANKATLVTRNRKHFLLVPGLHVENWAD